MTDREIMQMALDALENAHANEPIWKTPIKEASEALRARLAQPEPWVKTYSGGKPNYTEPPCKTGSSCTNKCERCGEVNPAEIHTCTPKQPEPVAWMFEHYTQWFLSWDWRYEVQIEKPFDDPDRFRNIIPLYTAPPQREWVGLTDDEIDDIWAEFNDGYSIIEETLWGYERAIEAKIREKNA